MNKPDRRRTVNPDRLIPITIDGQELSVPEGSTILDAAERLGIRIPTLCYHPDLQVVGICRICVVEIEGDRELETACAYQIDRPISVLTHTPKIRRARRHILELLLSEHYGDCTSCVRSHNCELQRLAKEYGITHHPFGHPNAPPHSIDANSPAVVRDMSKCIRCRRCIRACEQMQGVGALGLQGRGDDTCIAPYLGKNLGDVVCISCGQCVNRCPTGALREQSFVDEVWEAIDDPQKHVVIQTAPSPRAGIGEEFGCPPGTALTGQLNTALRMLGFNRVFDTNFAADLTIIEEGTELLLRLQAHLTGQSDPPPLPMFTSCSPGWVKYLEHFYPDYVDHLSTAKSPQQMFGTVIKTYYAEKQKISPEHIVTVALMPCTAKKFECNRPEMCDSGFKDVDYGLTTRELAQMIKCCGIHLPDLIESGFDDPFGQETGSGVIFGASGGVAESAMRTILELVTGSPVDQLFENAELQTLRGFEEVKRMRVTLPRDLAPVPEIWSKQFEHFDWLAGATLHLAVTHGTAHARKLLDNIREGGEFSQCQFIEFMACPGGCLGGGGQPIPTNAEIRAARAQAIYREDDRSLVRKSFQNPAIHELYGEFFTDGPCGKKSHRLLHTRYTARGKYIA